MSELRKDPVTNRWVIIAPDRAKRPHEFQPPEERRSDQACPFCEGNEDETPPEVVARREPGTEANRPGWQVRVVPNKFPALRSGAGEPESNDDLYRAMAGQGAHEVIIESPEHVISASELSGEQLSEVFWVYRERLAELAKTPGLAHGMVFKNVGASAGASIEHTHSQLIAAPVVPVRIEEELTGALEYRHRQGRCVYCEMIERESTDGTRIVMDRPGFTAFCPFASRFPYETWILPKQHRSHFEGCERSEMVDLAGIVRRVIAKIENALDRRAYNYIIHSSPFDTPELGHYHWHIEVMPSVTKVAGFEWGSGCHINLVSPESAASILRMASDEV